MLRQLSPHHSRQSLSSITIYHTPINHTHMPNDYTAITELPTAHLTADQITRLAHRYGYAHRLARGQRVLEVACGAGAALNYLADTATTLVGLDRSAGVLPFAQRASHAPLLQGDAQTLPFANAQFDLILCFEAIYYLPDYPAFLAECHRLLAPGGTLLICQSNPDWPNFVAGALTTHYPSLPELVTACTRTGFSTTHASGILPITAATPRQRLINIARRWVTQSGILPRLGPLKRLLQAMSYGELHPLPAAIDAAWIAQYATGVTCTPLVPDTPDRTHRVIYLESRKPQA